MYKRIILTILLLFLSCTSGRYPRISQLSSNAAQCSYSLDSLALYSKTTCSFLLFNCKWRLFAVGAIRQKNENCHFDGLSVSDLGSRELTNAEIDQMFGKIASSPDYQMSNKEVKDAYQRLREEIPVSRLRLTPTFYFDSGKESPESSNREMHVFDVEYAQDVHYSWGRFATEVSIVQEKRLIWHGSGK